ncbi:hypothetical protein TRIUR3_13222 [Triticum urartu]|uniref:Uncharacterized protein n=1 Tax=Triticum urartu TaxID=4572 RepID=M7ZUJ2_TRIUA|nr:hypothetical protein TRIUR3_13222 [Triticum urartu]
METMMAELLDVLARRMETGGRGIDDDDDDREFGLVQVVGYERGRGDLGTRVTREREGSSGHQVGAGLLTLALSNTWWDVMSFEVSAEIIPASTCKDWCKIWSKVWCKDWCKIWCKFTAIN